MRLSFLAPSAVSLMTVLALSGCSQGSSDQGYGDAGSGLMDAPPGLDQPHQDIPPATAPPGTVMPGQAMTASWDGLGDAQFGMDGEQVQMVWPGELKTEVTEGSTCHHLIPAGGAGAGHLALMVDDGLFLRYSVSSAGITAPGGGALGMDIPAIEALYPDRVAQTGHEYVTGGRYLRIQEDGGARVLLFETDEKGVVTEWRVGLPPQIDYSEGCS